MNPNLMDPKLLMLAAVVILVIAVVAWLYMRKRRNTTASLRKKFGPEYDNAMAQSKDRRHAEAELQRRADRVAKFLRMRMISTWP